MAHMAGTMVEFAGNGQSYSGYLAKAEGGGPGVVVIQEWWGLVGHIKSVADRFAKAGFTAIAPDFYHGRATAEPDEAGTLMMALNVEDAAKVVRGAVDALLAQPETLGGHVGVVGFCMGGQLSMFAATVDPRITACVNFYGVHPMVKPDFSNLNGPVLGFFAEHDEYASPEAVAALKAELEGLEKPHEFHTFGGTHHAFFNDDRPEVYNPEAAEKAWARTVEFFRENVSTAGHRARR